MDIIYRPMISVAHHPAESLPAHDKLRSVGSTLLRFLDAHPCTMGESGFTENFSGPLHYIEFTFFTSKKEGAHLIKTFQYEADMAGLGMSVNILEPPPASFGGIHTHYIRLVTYGTTPACQAQRDVCATCPMMERCMDGMV